MSVAGRKKRTDADGAGLSTLCSSAHVSVHVPGNVQISDMRDKAQQCLIYLNTLRAKRARHYLSSANALFDHSTWRGCCPAYPFSVDVIPYQGQDTWSKIIIFWGRSPLSDEKWLDTTNYDSDSRIQPSNQRPIANDANSDDNGKEVA